MNYKNMNPNLKFSAEDIELLQWDQENLSNSYARGTQDPNFSVQNTIVTGHNYLKDLAADNPEVLSRIVRLYVIYSLRSLMLTKSIDPVTGEQV